MKILCFSDFHFFSKRLEYQLETCKWIAGQILELEPDLVVNCGDTNHTHNHMSVDTISVSTQGLGEIVRVCKRVNSRVLFIAGNHDQASGDGSQTVLSMFQNLAGVTCATNMPLISYVEDTTIIGCPYIPKTRQEDYLEKYRSDIEHLKPVIQFSHWEIKDIAYTPGGKISETGLHLESTVPSSCKLIVNGHYHHPAWYKWSPPLAIVGAPCYYNYADGLSELPRGILMIESQGDDFDLEWLENPIGPVYHTVRGRDAKEFLLLKPHLHPRLNLRVKLLDEEDEALWEDNASEIKESVASVRVFRKDHKEVKGEQASYLSLDYEDAISRYISKNNPGLDADGLREDGMRLIETASCM